MINGILTSINTIQTRYINIVKLNNMLLDEICDINLYDENQYGNPFGNNNISLSISWNVSFNQKIKFVELNHIMTKTDLINYKPHITIHIINFNKNHESIRAFVDTSSCELKNKGSLVQDFENEIHRIFSLYIKGMQLEYVGFQLLGKFHSIVYKPTDMWINSIFHFRKALHEYINMKAFGVKNINNISIDRKNDNGKINSYVVYCNKNELGLYSVNINQYSDMSIWKPHVSIVSEENIDETIKMTNELVGNMIPKIIIIDSKTPAKNIIC